MSGQWEVVRGKNDRKSKLPVAKNAGKQPETKTKKGNVLNGVKLEEVLPKSQVKNLYAGKQQQQQPQGNNKPQEKSKPEVKKNEKKPNKTPSEPPKPKPPKSIEAGLLAINIEEFSLVYDRSKTAFPDAPIVWLKELTQFLNHKIPVEIPDPIFSNKPFGYPLNVVPSSIKSIIEKAIKEAGRNNAQLYFDIALTSMATDLSKGLPAVGYRFFLQHIALNEPELVLENLHKHVSLRKSYENRANVTLAIMWAVGHVGVNDLNSGLKVFEELKLPLIELKNYSRPIVKYLLELTSRDHHPNTHLTKDQYLLITDTIFTTKKHFPVELRKDFIRNLPKLKRLLFNYHSNNKKEKLASSVEVFLKKIASTDNKAYQETLCDILLEIICEDQNNLTVWNKVYSKNLQASALLIKYISEHPNSVKASIRKPLRELFVDFATMNEQLSSKKRKDDGLKDAISALKKAQEKKKTGPKRSGFFRKLLSSLLAIAWLIVLTEPLYRPNKPTGDLYLFRFSRKIGEAGLWVDSKLEQNVPKPYYGQAKQFVVPYGVLASDFLKVAINGFDSVRGTYAEYVNEKYPVVVASIDSYAPGLIDNTQVIVKDAFAKSIYYYQSGLNYLQKEVFIGQLSPENIQRVVVGAYNTTSEKAIEYYHWVYEKVQTSIK